MAAVCAGLPARTVAKEWHVASGGIGTGTERDPFGSIQAALQVARGGDVVLVRGGRYGEALRTVRDGAPDAPITLRARDGARSVVVLTYGKALEIDHSFFVVEGLVFDAAYAPDDAVSVGSGTEHVVLRDVEVRHSGQDCINIGAAFDVLVDASLIHHCLRADARGRVDAHGIVASAVRRLTVRGTEIHTFSGDAVQLNRAGRANAPGWDEVLIEGCRFWLEPLPEAINGFPAGAVPGENAVDTKVADESPRSRLTIRDTQAWGFQGAAVRLQAAFNLKEKIDATVDGVTVWDSEIAFRVRGSRATPNGAWVRVRNAVFHDVEVAFRYENDIDPLQVWNSTVGLGVEKAFEAAASREDGLDVRNLLLLGPTLPTEAAGESNLAVGPEAFVDPASHDYRLSAGSRALDAGQLVEGLAADRAGTARPQGAAHDVGAYESCPSACAPTDGRSVRP
jgi:hypothetical protein